MSPWLDAHGRWLFVSGTDMRHADARFKRHGGFAVVISQLLPGARGLISLPAGIARMNVVWFMITNFVGTVVWCALLATAGNMLGVHYATVDQLLGPIGWAIIAAIAVLLLATPFVMRHRRKGRNTT